MSSKITVAIRTRPLNDRELRLEALETVKLNPGQVAVSRPLDGYSKAFNFDLAYSSHPGTDTFGSQERLYRDIGLPILEEALKGINQCLFAYGQTGSGKSYTMSGYDDPGVIPRLTADLFKRVSASDGAIQVWISFMEIYNEKIRDLLRPSGSPEESLSIFEHDQLGVVVPDATMAPVATQAEAQKLMSYGLSRRVSSATDMNETSSRSHAICTFHVQTKQAMARINLIDLAGSERLAKSNSTGDNQKEATSINLSLTNLGIVIKALSEKKMFVPFRNSKLTFLLKDSLSGNSRTYMIATISPSESEIEETISTLRFASNVKRIVTDPHVNFGTHEDMINALRGEITKLKEQLAAAASKPDMGAQMKVRSAVLKMMDASLAKKVEKRYSNVSEGHVEDPYLMNISSDPLKTGLLTIVLPVPESPLMIGSSSEKDNFVIRGEEILPSMAEISRASSGELALKLTNPIASVSVNGEMLSINQTKQLERNDIVQFGSGCKFRVVHPTENVNLGHTGPDLEWNFMRSSFLDNFPKLNPDFLSRLDQLVFDLSERIDRMNAESEEESFGLRIMLPASLHAHVKPESLVAIERISRADHSVELFTVERFRTYNGKVKTDRSASIPPVVGRKREQLIALLEDARNRLDLLEAKNKQLLAFHSR
jgi:hypothetical protein